MQGNKETFSIGNMFYKEYTKNEFLFLKMLHGIDNLHLDTITINNKEFIEMPKGHVISIDTITKDKRNNSGIRHIIIDNIPFILSQISLLNDLGIYYSDCLQFLYHNNKLYLIDMDIASFTDINCNYNNFNLLINFLSAFDINSKCITESLYYLNLFQETDINYTLYSEDKKALYNKLNNDTMTKNHVYYATNRRYIQANIKNIQVLTDNFNVYITETVLHPDIVNDWELTKVL